MSAPKCNEYDYINFLVAAQAVFSTLEAARTQPTGEVGPAHDAYAYTRLLQRLPPDRAIRLYLAHPGLFYLQLRNVY